MNATTPNVDTIICGDCLEEMGKLPDRSIDAIVTDPPYELAFMGKKWDASGIAYNVDMWGECLRVLKPGGHLLAFGGSRTYHRMACAIEDAGFIVHPMIAWVQGQGFPKATNLSKMLDKDNGAEREYLGPKVYADGTPGHVSDHEHEGWKRPWKSDPEHVKIIKGITAPSSPEAIQWDGWYYGRQSLKPAIEPIGMFQKPPEGRMVDNVRKWGCGAVNVDGCRIGPRDRTDYGLENSKRSKASCYGEPSESANFNSNLGRFPTNLIHDASPVVLAEFAKASTHSAGNKKSEYKRTDNDCLVYGKIKRPSENPDYHADSGSASRFFMACEFTPADYAPIVYYAKASRAERDLGLIGKIPISEGHSSYGECNETEEHAANTNGRLRNGHPTVKPLSLMRYLCKLITPPGGLILDPFGGSGTTGIAAIKEGFHYILIEQQEEYCEIARKRIAAVPARLDRWAEAEG